MSLFHLIAVPPIPCFCAGSVRIIGFVDPGFVLRLTD